MTPDAIHRPPPLLLGTIAVMAVLRAVVAASTDLVDDEAYYRLWALAPALSYYDHPPMVAWMIAAGRFLGGDNAFGIRLATLVTGLLGPLLLWRTTLLLFGAKVAEWSVWFALAMPLLTVGGVVITPDTPSVLFWGLTGWAMAELYASRNPTWWLVVGLCAGLGLLSKYTNLFVAAGILLWLISGPENRRHFRSWQLWAGGAVAGLLTLPVVVWNWQHGWASFAKQFGRVTREPGFAPTYVLEFVASFIGLASPIIAVFAAVGLWMVLKAAVARRDQPSILLASSVLPLLGYFFVHALHARVQPNWLAPLYPAFATCAAIAAKAGSERPGGFGARAATAALALGFALSALLSVHAVYPLVLRAAAKDPSSQMRGWRAFAAEVDRLRVANGACWIATSHYSITGQLAYHLAARAPVVQLNDPIRFVHLPPVSGDTRQCPALYVELVRRPPPAELASRFGSIRSLGTLSRSDHGQRLADYSIALLSDRLDPVIAPTAPASP